MKYYIETNHGGASFANRDDAFQALFLLAQYHDFVLDKKEVIVSFDRDGYYEKFPLSIRKVGD